MIPETQSSRFPAAGAVPDGHGLHRAGRRRCPIVRPRQYRSGRRPQGRPNPGGPEPVAGGPTTAAGVRAQLDSAGPYALRRLTLLEYQNTIRDLLGVTLSDTDRRGFSADQVVQGGYGSGAAIVTSIDSRQFLDVSAKVAAAATADLGKLLPAGCAAPAAGAEEGCIAKFVEELRAARLPPPAERRRDRAGSLGLLQQAARRRGGRHLRRGGARPAAGHPAVARVPLPLGARRRSPSRTAT